MKKYLLPLALLLLLTGCGITPEDDQILTPPTTVAPAEDAETDASTEEEAEETTEETTVPEEATEETTEPGTESPTAAPTAPVTQPPAPEADASSREAVIAAYKTALQDKINESSSISGQGMFDVTYSLYDMDHDGIPELLVRYGTCEADFRIAVYTYRDSALRLVEDDLPGGHTSFGYDYVANQIVLCEGHMGSGNMYWYDLDENGNLRFLIDTGYFEYAGEDTPEYDAYMKQYNVGWLDGSNFFGSDTTWVYRYPNGEFQSEEYGGLDYRYLENYPF